MNERTEGRRKRYRGTEDGREEKQAQAQVVGMGEFCPPGPPSSLRQLHSKRSYVFENQGTFENLLLKKKICMHMQVYHFAHNSRGYLDNSEECYPSSLSPKIQPHHGAALQSSNHEAEKRKLRRAGTRAGYIRGKE